MKNIKIYYEMFKSDIFSTKYTPLDKYEFSDYESLYTQYEELMIIQISLSGDLSNYINANDLANSIITLKKIQRNMILLNLLNESMTDNIEITKLSIEKDNFHFNVCVGLEIPDRANYILYNYGSKKDSIRFTNKNHKKKVFYELEFTGDEFDITKIEKYSLELIDKVESGSVQYQHLVPSHIGSDGLQFKMGSSRYRTFNYVYQFSHSGSYDINKIKINNTEELHLTNSTATKYEAEGINYFFDKEGFLSSDLNKGRFDNQTILFDSKSIYNIQDNILNNDFILTDYSIVKNPISNTVCKESEYYFFQKIINICGNDTIYHINKWDRWGPPYAWLCDNAKNINNVTKDKNGWDQRKDDKWKLNPWLTGVDPKSKSYKNISHCDFNEIQEGRENESCTNYDYLHIGKVFELAEKGLAIENMGYLKACPKINNTFNTFRKQDIYKKNKKIYIVINARDLRGVNSEYQIDTKEYILIDLKESIEKSNFYFAQWKGMGSDCFTGETSVIMQDGTSKRIDKIAVGDIVKSRITTSKVIGIDVHDRRVGYSIYSINNSKYFVTAEHPFNTEEGWKSINPLNTFKDHHVSAEKLELGDYLIKSNGIEELKNIELSKEKADIVYNLRLDNEHVYYANGYLVHNNKLINSTYCCYYSTKFHKLSLIQNKFVTSDGSMVNYDLKPTSGKFFIKKNLLIKAIKAKFGIMLGCTDSTAFNYKKYANSEDGSCCYISGCTDSLAINYNPNACFDDKNCSFLFHNGNKISLKSREALTICELINSIEFERFSTSFIKENRNKPLWLVYCENYQGKRG